MAEVIAALRSQYQRGRSSNQHPNEKPTKEVTDLDGPLTHFDLLPRDRGAYASLM